MARTQWQQICKMIRVCDEARGIFVEAKARRGKIGDPDLERIAGILSASLEYDSTRRARKPFRGSPALPVRAVSDASLTQQLFYAHTGKPIIVLELHDLDRLLDPGGLIWLLEEKIRALRRRSPSSRVGRGRAKWSPTRLMKLWRKGSARGTRVGWIGGRLVLSTHATQTRIAARRPALRPARPSSLRAASTDSGSPFAGLLVKDRLAAALTAVMVNNPSFAKGGSAPSSRRDGGRGQDHNHRPLGSSPRTSSTARRQAAPLSRRGPSPRSGSTSSTSSGRRAGCTSPGPAFPTYRASLLSPPAARDPHRYQPPQPRPSPAPAGTGAWSDRHHVQRRSQVLPGLLQGHPCGGASGAS